MEHLTPQQIQMMRMVMSMPGTPITPTPVVNLGPTMGFPGVAQIPAGVTPIQNSGTGVQSNPKNVVDGGPQRPACDYYKRNGYCA